MKTLASSLLIATIGIATCSSAVTVSVAGGTVTGTLLDSIESFRGIPFAQPPVGELRLRPPQKLFKPLGHFDATGTGPSCPQMVFTLEEGSTAAEILGSSSLLQPTANTKEDCLTLNIQRPEGIKPSDKLPVLFWIYGGGFEAGSVTAYNASDLITTGVSLNEPFIFVAVNYRVGGFGFLPGKEILADGAANLGLLDQRAGLEWVADNIASFGGDPARVTIWGESAGSMSVFDQIALYNGNNKYKGKALFRAGIMNSGSAVPLDPVDCLKAQVIYDTVAEAAGCTNAKDTLACLRAAPYDTFFNATNSVPGIFSYNSLALSYVPRPDGTVLVDSPEVLAERGSIAPVPVIIGDQEDEGTLFALFQTNITTTEALVKYLQSLYFSRATKTQLLELINTYSASAAAGSPFRTGPSNELYPGFKRLAAILGDFAFTLRRRQFLSSATKAHPDIRAWSYLSTYDYGTPYLGTYHSGDLAQMWDGVLNNFASRSMQTYYINFLHTLDPNVGASGYMYWPHWNNNQLLMNFSAAEGTLIRDNFRWDSYISLLKNDKIFRL